MTTPVILRNGERATVSSEQTGLPIFKLTGRRQGGQLEIWTEEGAWAEDRKPHPLDIVSIVTPDGQPIDFGTKKP